MPSPLSDVRRVYLETAVVALDLLKSSELGQAWDDISVLPAFRVSGLAGHLARSIFQVEEYLDGTVSGRPPITAVVYFGELEDTEDLNASMNLSVRDRGDEEASRGLDHLIQTTTGSLVEVKRRLETEPNDRLVTVYRGRVLSLDEYLKTRIVEFVVHIEDLALSIGAGAGIPVEAIELATDVVSEATRWKHGDLAFLRGMTRRERDDANATRLF